MALTHIEFHKNKIAINNKIKNVNPFNQITTNTHTGAGSMSYIGSKNN